MEVPEFDIVMYNSCLWEKDAKGNREEKKEIKKRTIGEKSDGKRE